MGIGEHGWGVIETDDMVAGPGEGDEEAAGATAEFENGAIGLGGEGEEEADIFGEFGVG